MGVVIVLMIVVGKSNNGYQKYHENGESHLDGHIDNRQLKHIKYGMEELSVPDSEGQKYQSDRKKAKNYAQVKSRRRRSGNLRQVGESDEKITTYDGAAAFLKEMLQILAKGKKVKGEEKSEGNVPENDKIIKFFGKLRLILAEEEANNSKSSLSE